MGAIADLYIRVSTDEQADKGYSLRDQEERLRRYCTQKNIVVRNIYVEDYSAKSFNRPEWKKVISDLRKQRKKKNMTLLLFTKWDRFSRNVSQAYQTIDILRELCSEPQAIEQPLDMDIPESKIMLSHYLTIPEVENERRALNVFYGMRRAKKEGRWMGTAPLGYVNKITEDKKKYIAIKEEEADLLRWAFEQILENNFSTEQIWRKVQDKANGRPRFSKNNFWVALRNPLYCGKIFIPAFKDEEAHFVIGQHEAIISERKFKEVQNILDGRTRISTKAKIVSMEHLPLRGFLKCPNCNRKLTGSASKGRNKYYYYYHCTTSCGTRFRAGEVNKIFEGQLKSLVPQRGMGEVFVESVIDDFKDKTKLQNQDRSRILREMQEQNTRLQKALIQKVDGNLDDEDYIFIKNSTQKRIEQLEFDLGQLSDQNAELHKLLKSELIKLVSLDRWYIEGTMEQKRQIIGSMFPENLHFDGTQHRTTRVNAAVLLIYKKMSEIQGKKNGTSLSFLDLSQDVTRLGLEPRTPTLKVLCSTN